MNELINNLTDLVQTQPVAAIIICVIFLAGGIFAVIKNKRTNNNK